MYTYPRLAYLGIYTTTHLGDYASFYDWFFSHIKHLTNLTTRKMNQWFTP
jgi:hypothetical protein